MSTMKYKSVGTKQSSKISRFNSKPKFDDDYSDSFDSVGVAKKWYEDLSDDPKEFAALPDDEVIKLKSEAEKLLGNDTLNYHNRTAKGSARSDYQWLKTIMSKGTASDKIAAYTVAIQNSPLHSLSTLRNMVSMVKVSKKKECIMVIDTLSELFLSDLLPPDRKLRPFESRPLSLLDSGSRKAQLVRWYFEDELKGLYRAFIKALQLAAQDSVDSNKEKAIAAIHKLLAGHPEQESMLLSNLVNKLGDPSQKVSSKTIYCLTQLLQVHPNMKGVVMEEIEKLLFRSNVSTRAQYYGVCFLTQFLLSPEDVTLAVNLIKLYFSFFRACLKKGEVDTRLMGALLTGVNRAYPFSKGEMSQISEHIETIYRVVHVASFNISIHALCLLYQVSHYTNAVSDRFYSALYKKLLDPQLSSSTQHATVISLTFRALKRDVSDIRVKAFIKRLLQICTYLPVPLACGIMYMVSQLMHKNKALSALEMRAKHLDGGPVDEKGEEDYAGEHYEDVKIEEPETSATPAGVPEVKQPDQETKPLNVDLATWFHTRNSQDGSRKTRECFDSLQRNPLFAGGEFCAYTELLELCYHFHPTVTLFANKILQGETISYSGDPLQDFTLARFLERFVFKNPKKNAEANSKQSAIFSRKRGYIPWGVKTMAVNSVGYLNTDEASIPVDELFMYRYMQKRKTVIVKKDKKKKDDDADSVASDEFEEMMDSLMGVKETDIDYADEVGDKLVSKKRKGAADDEEDDDDEDEDEDQVDNDDDIEEEGSDHFDELEEFDDAEDIEFGEDDEDDDFQLDLNDIPDDDDEEEMKVISKQKDKGKQLKKLKKGGVDRSVFASADEFAEMLQDTGASDFKLGGSGALSDKDKAGTKQLKWEMARDHWVSGGRKPQRGKRKGGNKPPGRPAKKFRK